MCCCSNVREEKSASSLSSLKIKGWLAVPWPREVLKCSSETSIGARRERRLLKYEEREVAP